MKITNSINLVTPVQERIALKLRINYWLAWMIIGELLGGTAYLAVLLSDGTMAWIGQLAGMYAIVVMLLGAGAIYVKTQLEYLLPALINFITLPSDQVQEWYTGELEKIYHTRNMVGMGVLFALIAMSSFIYQTQWYTQPSVWFGSGLGNLTVTVVVFILAVLAGMDLYMLIRIGLLIHNLPKLPIEMTIYQHPAVSIIAVGSTLQRISILAAIVYGLVGLTAIPLSPFRSISGWIVTSWLIFGGFVIILFFVVPQYRLHQAMSLAKANRIRNFSTHLSDALNKTIKEPSSDAVAYVKELFDIYNHLLQMPEWPFNAKNFISLASAVILPILLSLLQAYLTP